MTLTAQSLLERNTAAAERIAYWLPVVAVILALLLVLFLISIVSDLSTGQNERRDRKRGTK